MRCRDVDGEEVVTVKYRLYPNREQETKMNTFIDACREVYNHMLEVSRPHLDDGTLFPSLNELMRMASNYCNSHPEYSGVYSECMRQVVYRVYEAISVFKNLFVKNKGMPFPRFRSFRSYCSFAYPGLLNFKIIR